MSCNMTGKCTPTAALGLTGADMKWQFFDFFAQVTSYRWYYWKLTQLTEKLLLFSAQTQYMKSELIFYY